MLVTLHGFAFQISNPTQVTCIESNTIFNLIEANQGSQESQPVLQEDTEGEMTLFHSSLTSIYHTRTCFIVGERFIYFSVLQTFLIIFAV